MKSLNQNNGVWRQNWCFVIDRRKHWWSCKGSHLLLLQRLLYCTGRFGDEPFQSERQNQRHHQDRVYWLFNFFFPLPDLAQQIKNICPSLIGTTSANTFLFMDKNLKNLEQTESISYLFVLLVGKKWIKHEIIICYYNSLILKVESKY